MRDRNRGPVVPAPRTEPHIRLQDIVPGPSLAAQLLTAAADHLAKHKACEPLTLAGWGRALALADARVLSGYPQTVAENASCRAMAALSADLWTTARTRDEWAVILHATARTV
ncbi:hypothetical protein ACFW9O_25085 [Streptomyces sp. NPDC059499]|uniref:hypothetical protein n=1 Tax=Streptomyces sp. NPDC059499 TaxID=3346852 RepID=UPI0036BE096E